MSADEAQKFIFKLKGEIRTQARENSSLSLEKKEGIEYALEIMEDIRHSILKSSSQLNDLGING